MMIAESISLTTGLICTSRVGAPLKEHVEISSSAIIFFDKLCPSLHGDQSHMGPDRDRSVKRVKLEGMRSLNWHILRHTYMEATLTCAALNACSMCTLP